MRLRLGPATSKDLQERLNVSQPSLVRLLQELGNEVIRVGSTRKARYALRRTTLGLGEIPIYQIDEEGRTQKVGELTPVHPGFRWSTPSDQVFFGSLPYFLEDLRPSGFLGRLVPLQHPELDAPQDITQWSGDQTLRYLSRFGWNLIGNKILGEEAFQLFLKKQSGPENETPFNHRAQAYERAASDVLALGDAGSSAGGEQPKFLARKECGTQVIVKFSPPLRTEVGRRRGDLLICEHLAHQVVRESGIPASISEIVATKERVFLEVERFDRVGAVGRKGVISLFALDLEYLGKKESWSVSATELFRQKRIAAPTLEQIRWLDLFGALIANTDRHLGNLSFFEREHRIEGLAPVYDMSPMLFAPQQEQIVDRSFSPPLPSPQDSALWRSALPAALRYWKICFEHPLLSDDFRSICQRNLKKLEEWEELVRLLPS